MENIGYMIKLVYYKKIKIKFSEGVLDNYQSIIT